MTAYPAMRLPVEQDLRAFVTLLRRLGIPHRVTEEAGQQVLWVADEQLAASVQMLYQRYPQGDMPLAGTVTAVSPLGADSRSRHWKQAPMTIAVLLLTFLVALLTMLGSNLDALRWLTFQDFLVQGDYIVFVPLADSLAAGQVWRLFSPMLIHFGFLHLAMNTLWYWELGRRIERIQGRWYLLALTLFFSVIADVVQFTVSGASLFGGLSGVLYGLLGHYWIYQRLVPDPRMDLPKGVLVFMLAWLVICLTGVLGVLGFGAVANGAHVGGLLAGCCTGLLAGSWQRRRSQLPLNH